MQYDGSILINTEILTGGMEKGFELIKDEMSTVGITARKVGKEIELSFSKMDVSKPIANAAAKIQQLERSLSAVTTDYKMAVAEDDDRTAERMAAKRVAIYDKLEAAREKLAIEIQAAVEKEAAAEEKAAARAARAAEKEAEAKQRAFRKQFDDLGRPARRFNSRLREIVSGAFVFNVIIAGLRSVTSYFGTALMANDEFSSSLSQLKGSLMVAFQPILEFAIPVLTQLIQWLNVAVRALARYYSALLGKSYSEMKKNAQSLNNQAGAIENVGEAAKEAEKYLAGFDEINRMMSQEDYSSGTGGNGTSINAPTFDDVEIPSEWETAIDKLAMRIKDIFFEWDDLNPEIITEKLLTALTTVAGGLIGFALGGPKGALIGMVVGAGLGVVLSTIIFDGDGKLNTQELLQMLISVLGVVGGGLIGFAIGGPAGALIGATIGVGLTALLEKMTFDEDGTLSAKELEESLLSVLLVLGGAGIGFALGGPAGALFGATIGLGISFSLLKLDVAQSEGTITSEELINSLLSVLTVIGGTAVGFMVGGPAGAAIGALVGLGVSFAVLGTSFESVQKEYDGLNKKVGQWSRETTKTTESEFIEPSKASFNDLTSTMSRNIYDTKNSVIDEMSLAAAGVDTTFFSPVTKWSTQLAERISRNNQVTSNRTVADWELAARQTESGYVIPMQTQFEKTATWISAKFTSAKDKITDTWKGLPNWFKENITGPITEFFNELTEGLTTGFNKTADSVTGAIEDLGNVFNRVVSSISDAIADMISQFNKISGWLSSKRSGSTNTYGSSASRDTSAYWDSVSTYALTPEIPMLARGAVIPPNHKFLAVLGDQRSGTNIEAPLATIQEAVALVMEDVIQSNLAGHEATVALLQQILEAVLGIELDGETLSRAVNNYNRKMIMVRGGEFD